MKTKTFYTAPEMIFQSLEQNSLICLSGAEASTEQFEEIGTIEW